MTTLDAPEGQMGKKRHGCLTAYLVVMIIVNAAVAAMYLFASEAISAGLPGMPSWTFPVLILMSLLNVVFAVFLFQWKKWAFWGFVGTSVIALFVNLAIGLSISQSVGGLIGIAVLYAVLQIGDESTKGWNQLD